MQMYHHQMLRILLCALVFAVGSVSMHAQITADSNRLVHYETLYLVVNVKRPPFDNVYLRYALAMATDRLALTKLLEKDGTHYVAGGGFVPPYAGYAPIEHLRVMVDGEELDIVSYEPAAARRMSLKARASTDAADPLNVEILAYAGDEAEILTRALSEMWTRNLGVRVNITLKPWHEYLNAAERFDFAGVAFQGRSMLMAQPDTLLFSAMFELEKVGWTDREVMNTLDRIGSEHSYFRAASKLRATEERILRQMPIIPLFSRTP